MSFLCLNPLCVEFLCDYSKILYVEKLGNTKESRFSRDEHCYLPTYVQHLQNALQIQTRCKYRKYMIVTVTSAHMNQFICNTQSPSKPVLVILTLISGGYLIIIAMLGLL